MGGGVRGVEKRKPHLIASQSLNFHKRRIQRRGGQMLEKVAGKHHIERAVLFVDAAGVTCEKPDFWKSRSRIADIGLTDIDADIVHL